MYLDQANTEQLQSALNLCQQQYDTLKAAGLNLDLTRGKPNAEQLGLSDAMDGILNGNYIAADKTDTRNYGGLDGLPEAKTLFSDMLQVEPASVLIGGNSSLTLMHQVVTFAHFLGLNGLASAWQAQALASAGRIKFLCPCPGYDRHFTICESLGIELISVAMTDEGPDMDEVERLVKADPLIKGIWCVPRFSNPTGVVYSDETVERFARLGKIAGKGFRIFWDNAYSVHDFKDGAAALKPILACCREQGTEDSVLIFGSTSKITFAGAGLAFMGASSANLAAFKKHLSASSIGPDKVNQLRHVQFFKDPAGIAAHMQKHADLLAPRFEAVQKHLVEGLGDSDMGSWSNPLGGYFTSFDSRPGLAKKIVQLADDCGVKLTPAGATFPYGKDPQDCNIRIAPSFASVAAINQAMEVFVVCVKLASLQHALQHSPQ